jgi:hypothetical protein
LLQSEESPPVRKWFYGGGIAAFGGAELPSAPSLGGELRSLHARCRPLDRPARRLLVPRLPLEAANLESSGDLKAAFDALKGTPIALLPHLSAALGRVGLTGDRARTAMAVHSTALYLTKTLGLEMDNDVRAATNKGIVTARTPRAGLAAIPEGATGLSVASPQTSGPERTEDLVTGRNYSGQWYCQYGYRREQLAP